MKFYCCSSMTVANSKSLLVSRNAWVTRSRVNPISIRMLMFSSDGPKNNFWNIDTFHFGNTHRKKCSKKKQVNSLPVKWSWPCWWGFRCGKMLAGRAASPSTFCRLLSLISLSMKFSPPWRLWPRKGRIAPPLRKGLFRCCNRACNKYKMNL